MVPEFDSFGHKFKVLLQKSFSLFIVKANTTYNLETRKTRPWDSNTNFFLNLRNSISIFKYNFYKRAMNR